MQGKKKILDVLSFLIYQREISGNVTGDDCAGFYIQSVPGALDEPNFHVARSILKKFERDGYIKFTDTCSIKELRGFCTVRFLPKFKWLKLKYYLFIVLYKIVSLAILLIRILNAPVTFFSRH